MPTIAAAVSALPVKSVILDGELIAIDAKGKALL
jgi:ATP-dependent DNA ligase